MKREITNKYLNKKKRISENEFSIPTFDTLFYFDEYNYTLKQLKHICKHYTLKQTGNKNDLIDRILYYLKHYQSVVCIQKNWRRHLVKRFIQSKGEGYKNMKKCVNTTDFFLLDELDEIPKINFISIQDENGILYGFNISSLYTLIKNGDKYNPYTREKLTDDNISAVQNYIRLAKLLQIPLEIEMEENIHYLSPEQLFKLRVEKLFSFMDSMGNYTNSKWFLDLSLRGLYRYIREIVDLWNYRLQLPRHMKISICPPHGTPFYNISMDEIMYSLHYRNHRRIQEIVLSIMENLCYSSSSDDNKKLGIMYCLTVFTMVNEDAAHALPWLYNSIL